MLRLIGKLLGVLLVTYIAMHLIATLPLWLLVAIVVWALWEKMS